MHEYYDIILEQANPGDEPDRNGRVGWLTGLTGDQLAS